MGSLRELHTLITDSERAYILGLWCADGYFWSSSIGITNVDRRLVARFDNFFGSLFPRERIKLRTYYPRGQKPDEVRPSTYSMQLAKQTAYQLYVNSRPLLRLFRAAERTVAALPAPYIHAYFAGRFDGDGSVDKNFRNDLRITYSNFSEATTDQILLATIGDYKTRVYHYRSAHTYVLYVGRECAEQFLHDIAPYSVRVQSFLPRRDSIAEGRQLDPDNVGITR